MKLFITGGTGQLGRRLIPELTKRGDQVVALSRNRAAAQAKLPAGVEIVQGDPIQTGDWMKAVDGCDAAVNLVGESLFARRWNDDFKSVLRRSRIESTKNIVAAIGQATAKPKVLVNGSATGYYGFRGDEELTEASAPQPGEFLSDLCKDWEAAAEPATTHGCRVVLLRTGVVLDKNAGALKQMMFPFKMFAGGPVGSGRQWVSWIHHADETGLILFALGNAAVTGPLNAVAPNPATNAELGKALGKALGRPSFMPTPGFALKGMLGEVADLVLKSTKVLPKKALELGYRFKYPEVMAAVADAVRS